MGFPISLIEEMTKNNSNISSKGGHNLPSAITESSFLTNTISNSSLLLESRVMALVSITPFPKRIRLTIKPPECLYDHKRLHLK